MTATPEPTPAGPLTVGRAVLTPERVAVLTALLPFGFLVLGVVAVVVLAGRRGGPSPSTDTPPPPPPAPVPPVTPPAAPAIEESPPPAPSPEPAIPPAA